MPRLSYLAALGVVLSAVSLPVSAEEMTITHPIAAATLHEGPLDMVAYYREVTPGTLEVTASFAPTAQDSAPKRIVLALRDGDDVGFSIPGYRGANYGFARNGSAVTISVDAPERTASAY